MAAFNAALPALIANLAVEVAPVRVNLMAAGFVDTPLSARLLGGDLDARRAQLAARLPIGRVVGQADIAALAVHLMINTAVTGATYDIDGGEATVALAHHIGAGLSDYWHSNSSSSFTAYVTSSIGDGTLSSPGKPSKALHAHQTCSTSGKEVIVTASQSRGMTYSLTGSGHLSSTH